MHCEVKCCLLKADKADQLCVALKFFGKTLAIVQIVCYKRINFGKSPSLAAFLPKTAQFAHSNIDGVIKRNWWAGKCWVLGFMQARGDTGPLKKLQLRLAMNPSMAAFEAVKAARTPQLWGR
jgi:hypothetical protein